MQQFNARLLLALCASPLLLSQTAQAVGYKPAPAVGQLGHVVVNPYHHSPLTAIIDLASKKPTHVQVTVKGKGEQGVDIRYQVGQTALNSHDGIPVFGLYADFRNTVEVSYQLDGKQINESYSILTGALQNKYIDSRNVTALQEVQVKTVNPAFEDRLYLINSATYTVQGTDIHWSGQKAQNADLLEATPSMGSLPFDSAPITYIIDTQGEIRWWLEPEATYDGKDIDINRRGYLTGFHDNGKGQFTFNQGQSYGTFNLLGQIDSKRLPRGYIDASHESLPMPNGNMLVRAAKANYLNSQGDVVHTVRDHILELDPYGNLVDVWNLNTILDPYRDDMLRAIDQGAVCMNVDLDSQGQTADIKIDAPYGDITGIVAGRNWAHANSIDYSAEDDSLIVSVRHQGVVKISRDKQLTWILSPSIGWSEKFADKVLTPVDRKGEPLICGEKGDCQGEFDFSYNQHTAWLNDKNGRLTVFDNGGARNYRQPLFLHDNYSRFVEYAIDEQKMTVQQTWHYGKERGYDWFSPVTSNVEYRSDKNTMFGFGGSIHLFEAGERTIGKINEINYDTKAVEVEIDVLTDKPNGTHYRAVIVDPTSQFGF